MAAFVTLLASAWLVQAGNFLVELWFSLQRRHLLSSLGFYFFSEREEERGKLVCFERASIDSCSCSFLSPNPKFVQWMNESKCFGQYNFSIEALCNSYVPYVSLYERAMVKAFPPPFSFPFSERKIINTHHALNLQYLLFLILLPLKEKHDSLINLIILLNLMRMPNFI